MKLQPSNFSILITTKNRLSDLIFTLQKINFLLLNDNVQCIICDDGSTDGTSDFITANYPNIHLIRNEESKGLIYSRNRLLHMTTAEYAISIDDDLHFITENPLELIAQYFEEHPECGIIGFRIFWSKSPPTAIETAQQAHRVKSFPGGANVWRIKAWNQIPDYPDWFIFHGEEDFASYELFKKNIEVHYLPSVLVHHRVDLKSRKRDADYMIRLKRSLRSGWYLFFLFFPLTKIPRLLLYTIWIQIKLKVLKGDFKALQAIILALFDLMFSFPKIIKYSNRLTLKEYNSFQKLEDVKLYWKPEN